MTYAIDSGGGSPLTASSLPAQILNHMARASGYALGPGVACLLISAACARGVAVDPAPVPDTAPPPVRVVVETVTVRDRDMEQRLSRNELRLMEYSAQVEDLQARLEETQREVVRSMAKVQTLASRAEAASGMAEAEVATQTLRRTVRGQAPPELAKATKLLKEAQDEFDRQNYGGALWLASQSKTLASVGRSRVSAVDQSSLRPGEVMFAVPVSLRTSARSNMREGPGTNYRSLQTVDAGTALTGYSYVDQWIRVEDNGGRSGWVYWSLVETRSDARP
jgi:Bacterial SH3 domain